MATVVVVAVVVAVVVVFLSEKGKRVRLRVRPSAGAAASFRSPFSVVAFQFSLTEGNSCLVGMDLRFFSFCKTGVLCVRVSECEREREHVKNDNKVLHATRRIQ
jgi:hypothetical protein